jgi:hypothetical protein
MKQGSCDPATLAIRRLRNGGRRDREGPVIDDAFHHDRRDEALHARQGGEFLVAQDLVGGQVGSGHPDQVVRIAEQPFRLAHFRNADQAALEPGNGRRGQVAPSLWAAYRTARPTGISSGTWLLILGELSCWLVFGLYKSDPRLIALGVTGVIASTLILARIHRTSKREQPAAPSPAS